MAVVPPSGVLTVLIIDNYVVLSIEFILSGKSKNHILNPEVSVGTVPDNKYKLPP
jgi:hypothetical protein